MTFENVQAWLRKFLLFSLASQRRGIDLGTGDLSEIALGWSTYGGDHMSHYGVNAGVPKTLVSALIGWAADTCSATRPRCRRCCATSSRRRSAPSCCGAAPTARSGSDSEAVVGPYELHDFFLYHFLRFGFGPRRIARLALHAFGGRYALAEIRRRWLLVFVRRFFANQFKRDCVPDGRRRSARADRCRRAATGACRPSAAVDAWLAEAETIPDE